jgi:hypothetical protein
MFLIFVQEQAFGNIMAGRDEGHGVQVTWIHLLLLMDR